MKKLILIPIIPLAIVPTFITGCDRHKEQQYLEEIAFFHNEMSDALGLQINFADWKYNWDVTEISYTSKAVDFMTNCTKLNDKCVNVGYSKLYNTDPDYEIIDTELAITLKENASYTSLTYKFYLYAQIKDFELEKYNFHLIK